MQELSVVATATNVGSSSETWAGTREEPLSSSHRAGAKVLLLADDHFLVDLLAFSLKRAGHEVLAAFDPKSALHQLEQHEPSLLVLDVMADGSGLDLLQKIRSQSEIPIIILSKNASEADKVLGLDLGADDYVTKPFSLQEFLARVRAALRRSAPHGSSWSPSPSGMLEVGPLTMSLAEQKIFKDGKLLPLSKTERRLLHLTMLHAGSIVSWREAARKVWGYEDAGAADTVRVAVYRLRRKLEDDPANPRLLRTVPGEGVILNP